MKKAIPLIQETPEELRGLIKTEHDGQKRQRLQALYLLQTQQARTRQQVAALLGVHRHTVGHWLAAYAHGGLRQLVTLAKVPGKVPLVPPAVREALQARLTQPQGFASDQAIWEWLQQEQGLQLAYNTVHKLVRYTLRAKLKVPRASPIENP
jgi:transposase